MTSRAAPRAKFDDPSRSRVAAITGADNGVDIVAINALLPLHAGVPVPVALFGIAVRLPDGVVDVDETQPVQIRPTETFLFDGCVRPEVDWLRYHRTPCELDLRP